MPTFCYILIKNILYFTKLPILLYKKNMKNKFLIILAILSLLLSDCNKDDNNVPESLKINDFVWKGLNKFYFWQTNIDNLADNRFSNQSALNTFLNTYSKPKELFDDLLFKPSDKWSWIVDDYIALERRFQGITKNNGVEFGLVRIAGSNTIFGFVRYILPDSDASNKNIARGDLFTKVNGQQLTLDNYRTLLFGENDTYTLSLAQMNAGEITLTGETVSLTKTEYTENPIFIRKTFDISGHKIGYLMYNAFTANFDEHLNTAFGQFKAEGISDLVLDLRYNGGGRVKTAKYLASMITGQFTGQLFSREHWNSKLQAAIEDSNPSRLLNNFSNKIIKKDTRGNIIFQQNINSLQLTKLHVLISGSSASASELIINSLKPYIAVKLIGTKTVGKYVASITLYDSHNFNRAGVNPNHTYAMQPIALEEVNKLGANDKDGFDPDILLAEDFENMGNLGNINEPLLQRALNDITGGGKTNIVRKTYLDKFEPFTNSNAFSVLYNEMYTEAPIYLTETELLYEDR